MLALGCGAPGAVADGLPDFGMLALGCGAPACREGGQAAHRHLHLSLGNHRHGGELDAARIALHAVDGAHVGDHDGLLPGVHALRQGQRHRHRLGQFAVHGLPLAVVLPHLQLDAVQGAALQRQPASQRVVQSGLCLLDGHALRQIVVAQAGLGLYAGIAGLGGGGVLKHSGESAGGGEGQRQRGVGAHDRAVFLPAHKPLACGGRDREGQRCVVRGGVNRAVADGLRVGDTLHLHGALCRVSVEGEQMAARVLKHRREGAVVLRAVGALDMKGIVGGNDGAALVLPARKAEAASGGGGQVGGGSLNQTLVSGGGAGEGTGHLGADVLEGRVLVRVFQHQGAMGRYAVGAAILIDGEVQQQIAVVFHGLGHIQRGRVAVLAPLIVLKFFFAVCQLPVAAQCVEVQQELSRLAGIRFTVPVIGDLHQLEISEIHRYCGFIGDGQIHQLAVSVGDQVSRQGQHRLIHFYLSADRGDGSAIQSRRECAVAGRLHADAVRPDCPAIQSGEGGQREPLAFTGSQRRGQAIGHRAVLSGFVVQMDEVSVFVPSLQPYLIFGLAAVVGDENLQLHACLTALDHSHRQVYLLGGQLTVKLLVPPAHITLAHCVGGVRRHIGVVHKAQPAQAVQIAARMGQHREPAHRAGIRQLVFLRGVDGEGQIFRIIEKLVFHYIGGVALFIHAMHQRDEIAAVIAAFRQHRQGIAALPGANVQLGAVGIFGGFSGQSAVRVPYQPHQPPGADQIQAVAGNIHMLQQVLAFRFAEGAGVDGQHALHALYAPAVAVIGAQAQAGTAPTHPQQTGLAFAHKSGAEHGIFDGADARDTGLVAVPAAQGAGVGLEGEGFAFNPHGVAEIARTRRLRAVAVGAVRLPHLLVKQDVAGFQVQRDAPHAGGSGALLRRVALVKIAGDEGDVHIVLAGSISILGGVGGHGVAEHIRGVQHVNLALQRAVCRVHALPHKAGLAAHRGKAEHCRLVRGAHDLQLVVCQHIIGCGGGTVCIGAQQHRAGIGGVAAGARRSLREGIKVKTDHAVFVLRQGGQRKGGAGPAPAVVQRGVLGKVPGLGCRKEQRHDPHRSRKSGAQPQMGIAVGGVLVCSVQGVCQVQRAVQFTLQRGHALDADAGVKGQGQTHRQRQIADVATLRREQDGHLIEQFCKFFGLLVSGGNLGGNAEGTVHPAAGTQLKTGVHRHQPKDQISCLVVFPREGERAGQHTLQTAGVAVVAAQHAQHP